MAATPLLAGNDNAVLAFFFPEGLAQDKEMVLDPETRQALHSLHEL
ncbi:hypothetical protein CCP3SC15_60040 [Gammaproteobacteria bacterium]